MGEADAGETSVVACHIQLTFRNGMKLTNYPPLPRILQVTENVFLADLERARKRPTGPGNDVGIGFNAALYGARPVMCRTAAELF